MYHKPLQHHVLAAPSIIVVPSTIVAPCCTMYLFSHMPLLHHVLVAPSIIAIPSTIAAPCTCCPICHCCTMLSTAVPYGIATPCCHTTSTIVSLLPFHVCHTVVLLLVIAAPMIAYCRICVCNTVCLLLYA